MFKTTLKKYIETTWRNYNNTNKTEHAHRKKRHGNTNE